MGMTMTTPMSEVDALTAACMKEATRLWIRALSFLGEKCVIEARDRSQEESWFDQTGNLRSSVGYVIVADGKIVSVAGFKKVKGGSEGFLTGQSLAKKLAENYPIGYALIVVAGMNYAAKVEAMDNKVVLASAELYARRELPKLQRQLRTQVAKIAA
jgi:hypothetical protein